MIGVHTDVNNLQSPSPLIMILLHSNTSANANFGQATERKQGQRGVVGFEYYLQRVAITRRCRHNKRQTSQTDAARVSRISIYNWGGGHFYF